MNDNLIACPDCGATVSRLAYSCPHCGRKIRTTPVNLLATLILGAIALVIVGAIVRSCGDGATNPGTHNPDSKIIDDINKRQEDANLRRLQDLENARKK